MMRGMLNARRRQVATDHLAHTAEKHGIRIRWTRDVHTSEADFVTRTVFIPKEIRSGADYLVSLHEMGHLVAPGAQGMDFAERPGHFLKVEAAAWAWAVDRALPEVMEGMTIKDRRLVGLSWATYIGDVWLAEDSR